MCSCYFYFPLNAESFPAIGISLPLCGSHSFPGSHSSSGACKLMFMFIVAFWRYDQTRSFEPKIVMMNKGSVLLCNSPLHSFLLLIFIFQIPFLFIPCICVMWGHRLVSQNVEPIVPASQPGSKCRLWMWNELSSSLGSSTNLSFWLGLSNPWHPEGYTMKSNGKQWWRFVTLTED